MMIALIVVIGAGFLAVEHWWPAAALPRVRAWYSRVILINAIQAAIIVVIGTTWDRWLSEHSVLRLRDSLEIVPQAVLAYVVAAFVFYWWHRLRHTSVFWWRLCHQLHHSAQRIEVLTSFYKHPVEITLNALLSSVIAYGLLGISIEAAMISTLVSAVAEFFYHWNVRTPRWLGPIIQRPESHRIHHKRNYHTNNYGDLPVLDWLFGTYQNAAALETSCGFANGREGRLAEMLAFRDVHDRTVASSSPLHLVPTCIGCRKRWACSEARCAS
jgi:sterol desaturase/sphingolipid hydroxylase (fatty acid hydroxylase superfamily)